MPFLQELFQTGTLHRVHSCLPEISSVNWSSFMTGANPGEHGIFGFTDLAPDSYTMRFPAFTDLKTETIWDKCGRAGKRCLVLNQPSCYPAREIPGAVVSGFVAIDLKRAVSPRRHIAPLEAMDYKVDVDTQASAGDVDRLFAELEACLDARRRAAEYFFKQEPWDFAEVVITGTDRLQHFLWTSCDGDGPQRDRALDYYRQCDALLKWLVEAFYGGSEPENLFLMSDHGFTRLEKELALNAWLREEGYLAFEKEPPESYEDISAGAQAFAMDPGRIYIHRKGRYPKGQVEGDGPVEEIKAKLEALTYEGAPVFTAIYRRDEVYQGPETCHGPDLICVPRHGIDVKGAIRRHELFADSRFTGMHTSDDAFFWASQDYGNNLTVADVGNIVVADLC